MNNSYKFNTIIPQCYIRWRQRGRIFKCNPYALTGIWQLPDWRFPVYFTSQYNYSYYL